MADDAAMFYYKTEYAIMKIIMTGNETADLPLKNRFSPFNKNYL